MDSRDPSHLSHHHPQPPPPSHPGILLSQNQQQHMPNSSYPLPSNNNSINSAAIMHQQNPVFPFNSMAVGSEGGPKPMDHMQGYGSQLGGGFSIEPARKKRGRPRKYSPDNSIGLGLSPAPVSQIPPVVDSGGGGGGTPSSENPSKKHRGRPPGSVKRQLDALGASGVGFTPHVITVDAGEDIASKLMDFSRQGPRTVCILSANGAICNVTLRQPAMSGGTVTYEGRFEIISLTGSFLLSDSHNQSGGLSVSLAGSDGRVLGGGVAGMLKAASPVQVVVGSFIADGKKPKSGQSSTAAALNFGGTGTSPSPGDSSDSGEENDDTSLNHGYGQPGQNMPMYSSMGWPNSMKILPS